MGRKTARLLVVAALVTTAAFASAGCKSKTVTEAEAKRDVSWLAEDGSAQSVAALGRLADTEPKALSALEARAARDVNVYIAGWESVTRGTAWGAPLLRAGLADPTRADVVSAALPRGNPKLVAFIPDLDAAVVRLSAGQRGGVVAGVLASIGPAAHPNVEKRLVDPKTRGAMCDGISLADASGDAKSLVLAVPAEARDHASCVNVVVSMAKSEDVVLDWLGTGAEPGLLSATAKSELPCARLTTVWGKGLVTRPPEQHSALTVPLQLSIRRCAATLDPVLADLLAKAPRARPCIVQAIEPYGELGELKQTCKALKGGWVSGEGPRVREHAADALAHGCSFAR